MQLPILTGANNETSDTPESSGVPDDQRYTEATESDRHLAAFQVPRQISKAGMDFLEVFLRWLSYRRYRFATLH